MFDPISTLFGALISAAGAYVIHLLKSKHDAVVSFRKKMARVDMLDNPITFPEESTKIIWDAYSEVAPFLSEAARTEMKRKIDEYKALGDTLNWQSEKAWLYGRIHGIRFTEIGRVLARRISDSVFVAGLNPYEII